MYHGTAAAEGCTGHMGQDFISGAVQRRPRDWRRAAMGKLGERSIVWGGGGGSILRSLSVQENLQTNPHDLVQIRCCRFTFVQLSPAILLHVNMQYHFTVLLYV